GGRKPWKQKGTGNARAGSIRSPLWVGGGRTFAARPRNFAQKINRKMYVRSMTSILSQLVRENRVHVVTEIKIAEAKTKQLLEQLNNWKIDSKAVLILTHEMDASVMLAARNVHWVKYDLAQNVNPVDLICAETVIVSEGSLKVLEERLA
ncbi:MAG TPA: 50S ribosomal protein L4, partial [Flavobacteriales bacterium]|nr:50S ribosomal protein L4 [Flavobacteriales bacterium]